MEAISGTNTGAPARKIRMAAQKKPHIQAGEMGLKHDSNSGSTISVMALNCLLKIVTVFLIGETLLILRWVVARFVELAVRPTR